MDRHELIYYTKELQHEMDGMRMKVRRLKQKMLRAGVNTPGINGLIDQIDDVSESFKLEVITIQGVK